MPLDSSPATCHNNTMKQTMVDSSCRILTSDIFQDCNKLVRAVGVTGGRRVLRVGQRLGHSERKLLMVNAALEGLK